MGDRASGKLHALSTEILVSAAWLLDFVIVSASWCFVAICVYSATSLSLIKDLMYQISTLSLLSATCLFEYTASLRDWLSNFTKSRISLFRISSRSLLMKTTVFAPSIQAIALAESVDFAILRSLEIPHERKHASSVLTLTRNIKNAPCIPQSRTLDKDASVNTSIVHSFERAYFGKLNGISFSICTLRKSLLARVRSRTFATEAEAARLLVSEEKSGLPFVAGHSSFPTIASFHPSCYQLSNQQDFDFLKFSEYTD